MAVTFQGFGGLPSGSMAKYRTAYFNAKYYVSQARRQAKSIWPNRGKVGTGYSRARDRFKLFWGPVTEERCALVAENYRLVALALNGDLTIIYDANDDSKAYVYVSACADAPGGDFTAEMRFCPPLLEDFAAIGTNSAMGTIVHEMSHLVLGTEDHVYGMKSCTELTPGERVENADNFKYYTERFQYRLGTEPDLTDDVDIHTPPRRV